MAFLRPILFWAALLLLGYVSFSIIPRNLDKKIIPLMSFLDMNGLAGRKNPVPEYYGDWESTVVQYYPEWVCTQYRQYKGTIVGLQNMVDKDLLLCGKQSNGVHNVVYDEQQTQAIQNPGKLSKSDGSSLNDGKPDKLRHLEENTLDLTMIPTIEQPMTGNEDNNRYYCYNNKSNIPCNTTKHEWPTGLNSTEMTTVWRVSSGKKGKIKTRKRKGKKIARTTLLLYYLLAGLVLGTILHIIVRLISAWDKNQSGVRRTTSSTNPTPQAPVIGSENPDTVQEVERLSQENPNGSDVEHGKHQDEDGDTDAIPLQNEYEDTGNGTQGNTMADHLDIETLVVDSAERELDPNCVKEWIVDFVFDNIVAANAKPPAEDRDSEAIEIKTSTSGKSSSSIDTGSATINNNILHDVSMVIAEDLAVTYDDDEKGNDDDDDDQSENGGVNPEANEKGNECGDQENYGVKRDQVDQHENHKNLVNSLLKVQSSPKEVDDLTPAADSKDSVLDDKIWLKDLIMENIGAAMMQEGVNMETSEAEKDQRDAKNPASDNHDTGESHIIKMSSTSSESSNAIETDCNENYILTHPSKAAVNDNVQYPQSKPVTVASENDNGSITRNLDTGSKKQIHNTKREEREGITSVRSLVDPALENNNNPATAIKGIGSTEEKMVKQNKQAESMSDGVICTRLLVCVIVAFAYRILTRINSVTKYYYITPENKVMLITKLLPLTDSEFGSCVESDTEESDDEDLVNDTRPDDENQKSGEDQDVDFVHGQSLENNWEIPRLESHDLSENVAKEYHIDVRIKSENRINYNLDGFNNTEYESKRTRIYQNETVRIGDVYNTGAQDEPAERKVSDTLAYDMHCTKSNEEQRTPQHQDIMIGDTIIAKNPTTTPVNGGSKDTKDVSKQTNSDECDITMHLPTSSSIGKVVRDMQVSNTKDDDQHDDDNVPISPGCEVRTHTDMATNRNNNGENIVAAKAYPRRNVSDKVSIEDLSFSSGNMADGNVLRQCSISLSSRITQNGHALPSTSSKASEDANSATEVAGVLQSISDEMNKTDEQPEIRYARIYCEIPRNLPSRRYLDGPRGNTSMQDEASDQYNHQTDVEAHRSDLDDPNQMQPDTTDMNTTRICSRWSILPLRMRGRLSLPETWLGRTFLDTIDDILDYSHVALHHFVHNGPITISRLAHADHGMESFRIVNEFMENKNMWPHRDKCFFNG